MKLSLVILLIFIYINPVYAGISFIHESSSPIQQKKINNHNSLPRDRYKVGLKNIKAIESGIRYICSSFDELKNKPLSKQFIKDDVIETANQLLDIIDNCPWEEYRNFLYENIFTEIQILRDNFMVVSIGEATMSALAAIKVRLQRCWDELNTLNRQIRFEDWQAGKSSSPIDDVGAVMSIKSEVIE